MKNCAICGMEIPKERVEALETDLCLPCAKKNVSKKIGFMDFGHKTAPSLVVIDSRNKEAVRLATRAFRRAR